MPAGCCDRPRRRAVATDGRAQGAARLARHAARPPRGRDAHAGVRPGRRRRGRRAGLPLPPGAEVAVDARRDRGPLEGVATGVRALHGRAAAVFLAATDLPLLDSPSSPTCWRRSPATTRPCSSPAATTSRSRPPTTLPALERARALLDAGRPRRLDLLEGPRVRRIEAGELAASELVAKREHAAGIPRAARAAQPTVTVSAAGHDRRSRSQAATLGAAAARWRGGPDAAAHPIAPVNGVASCPPTPRPPLVAGDVVELLATRPTR